jgi:RNA polymerase sigma factor (sigma-70 family)
MARHPLASVEPPVGGLLSEAPGAASDRRLLERFVSQQDEAAFAALLDRHGPMVLSVCRRVLSHAQDAEDAFQATFLVLSRKAAFIAQPELLGSWLYGVAYRIARKARAQSARRRRRESERETVPMSAPDPLLEAAWRELRASLDEELRRLPVKYQAPLVLCYLEGLTNEEAARQLGWPVGSISYRLARGRDLLRERLSRRRRAIAPGLLPALLTGGPPLSDLPAGLAARTARAAVTASWSAATSAGLISRAVTDLAAGALAKGKWTVLLVIALLLLGGLAAGAASYAASAGGPPAAPASSCH